MTESEIISLIGEDGFEKAFGAIVDNYSEKLYWHVRHMVGSHEDADDLLQEIFIKVWTALPSFKGEARLYTWLWRIATNESLNFLRRQRLRSVLSFKSLSAGDDVCARDPYFNGDEAQALLMKAVSALPPKQKAVFLMRYFSEMKYEDISEILKTSVGSLKASYHIAEQKVRAELQKK